MQTRSHLKALFLLVLLGLSSAAEAQVQPELANGRQDCCAGLLDRCRYNGLLRNSFPHYSENCCAVWTATGDPQGKSKHQYRGRCLPRHGL